MNCSPIVTGNMTSDAGATISNGSGGAGTDAATSFSGNGTGVGIGMPVTGSGVTAGTFITGGSGTTFTVNQSQHVGPTTLTIHGGPQWFMDFAGARLTLVLSSLAVATRRRP